MRADAEPRAGRLAAAGDRRALRAGQRRHACTAPRRRRARGRRRADAATAPSSATAPELPLVGRERELAALSAAPTPAAAPDGRLAVIEGEAGIGKTRLFEELAAPRAARGGATVLSARCHDDEAGLPYGPVVELLRATLARRHGAGRGRWRRSASPTPRCSCPSWRHCGPTRRLRCRSTAPARACACWRPSAPCSPPRAPGRPPGSSSSTTSTAPTRRRSTRSPISAAGSRAARCCSPSAGAARPSPPGHRLRRLAVDAARDGAATIVSPGG